MPKKKLYFFILGFALTGYSWIAWNHFIFDTNRRPLNVCMFKLATGLPCPSCGTTHAVISITKGDFRTALDENILGFPVSVLLLVLPFWIAADLVLKKESFYGFYLRMENWLRKRWIAGFAILFILANWAWNIYRAL